LLTLIGIQAIELEVSRQATAVVADPLQDFLDIAETSLA
jgi:hypothetical protein